MMPAFPTIAESARGFHPEPLMSIPFLNATECYPELAHCIVPRPATAAGRSAGSAGQSRTAGRSQQSRQTEGCVVSFLRHKIYQSDGKFSLTSVGVSGNHHLVIVDIIDRQHRELAFGLERVEAHTKSAANSRAEMIRVPLWVSSASRPLLSPVTR
jgi:hypothetical protein